MHFWIDKRDTQLHYGRRRPPGVFYSRRLSGQKLAASNPPTSSSVQQQQTQTHGNSSAASTSTSNTASGFPSYQNNNHNNNHNHSHNSSSSSNSRSNNCMVTPVHRFTPIESTCRLNLANGNAAGNTSPSSRSSRNSNQRSGRSRSRSRSRSRDRDRARRSSSSLRGTPTYNGDAGGDGTVTPIPDFGQPLTTSSLSSSEISDPKWDRTKKTVGLTLCFLAFIILMLVTAKFVIEGPSLIDTSRRGQSEATTYFFIMELVFVLFAMTLFFTGVACLRKRTNEYLLRHFNQHILQSANGVPTLISHHPLNTSGYGLNNNNSSSDYFEHSSTHEDDENQENYFLQQQTIAGNTSGLGMGLGYHQQVHHHLLHPGISPTSSLPTCLFRNQMTSNSSNGHRSNNNSTHIIAVGPDGSRFAYGNSHPSSSSSSSGRHGHSHPHSHSNDRHHHHHHHRHMNMNMNMNVHSQQQPPPYHIALYLPLPSQNYETSVKPSIDVSSDILMKSSLASDMDFENDELVVVSATSQAGKDNQNQNQGAHNNSNMTSNSSPSINPNVNPNSSTGNRSESRTGENTNVGISSGTNLQYNNRPSIQQEDRNQVVVKPETPPPSYEEFNFKAFENI